MNAFKRLALLAVTLSFAAAFLPGAFAADKPAAKSAAELEKEKALANPYPNDFGPAELDKETLESYPKNIQAGYKALLGDTKKKNCQTCHTASRPLNSKFVEVEGKNDGEKKAALAKLQKEHPEYFKDLSIWKIEAGIWNRYVKRMMAKPGCGISNEDGKKIWEFLVYDSARRKIGANGEKWAAHRKKLIAELKAKNPKRYEQLAHDNEL